MAVNYTNKFNIPQEFVDAMVQDNHIVMGDISVTTLIDSPQVRMLKRNNDYSIDLSEQMAMFFGTAIHEKLETSAPESFAGKTLRQCALILKKTKPDSEVWNKIADWLLKQASKFLSLNEKIRFAEKTMTIELNGWTVSGTLDRYFIKDKLIRDYKTTTASQMMFPEQKESWYLQQNIYASMLRNEGYEVEGIEICAIIKDWSKIKAMTQKDYPQAPIVLIPVKIAKHEDVLDYIAKRIEIHQKAEAGEQIPCTKKDRWAKEDTFAVKKKGAKRSIKNFSSQQLAEAFLNESQGKFKEGEVIIEYRPSASFRCAHYCPVSSVCPQYKKELEIQANISSETF
jgi:hypothetical protein